MANIKLKALRDRRPKTEDITVETPGGAKIKFINPMKRKGVEGFEILDKLDGDMGAAEIPARFAELAENGEDDLQVLWDEECTAEDVLDILKSVGEEIGKQSAGTDLGESKG